MDYAGSRLVLTLLNLEGFQASLRWPLASQHLAQSGVAEVSKKLMCTLQRSLTGISSHSITG